MLSKQQLEEIRDVYVELYEEAKERRDYISQGLFKDEIKLIEKLIDIE